MERYPVLFRCDASPATGWEHLYRCQAYASALQRRRRTGYFCGALSPFPLLSQLARNGFEYVANDHPIGSPEDADATLRAMRKYQVAACVVAGDNLPQDYLRELASSPTMVIALDSGAGCRFPTKLVINPLMGPAKSKYEVEPGTQLLAGERYAMVRGIFRRQRALRAVEPPQPWRVMIAFGDCDLQGQTLQRVRELLNTPGIDKVSAVVRPHHPQIEALRECQKLVGTRLEILSELNEISTRLLRVHFALSAGDTFSMELACVGIPQMILSQKPSHALNGRMMDEAGAASYLGEAESVSPLRLREAVAALLDDGLERKGMARSAKKLVDGKGPDRIVAALEVMLPQRRARIAARSAA